MNSIYQPMATQSNTNKVTSIVRDNFATNANRELVTDKATLIASLNNTNNSNSSMNNSHLYQNIHHVTSKAPTNGSNNNNNNTNTNNGSVNGQKVIAPNANNITNTANSVNNPSPIKNSNANSTANSSKQRNLDGYVGFANLPNQVYRKFWITKR